MVRSDGCVDPKEQAQKIREFSRTFWAMLKTAALKDNLGISTKEPPYQPVKKIADYFVEKYVKEDFSEEPPLSFRVDNQSPDIINALKIAFNYGAIVSLDESGDIEDYDALEGKRFRISYLLAAELSLPLRSTKAVSIGTILNRRSADRHGDLFDES